jgi:hypothetical protein
LVVRVERDGYDPVDQKVTLPAGAQHEVRIELKTSPIPADQALLRVLTTPPGALVLVDGQPMADRTPAEYGFGLGQRKQYEASVEVSLDGYATVRRSVVLRPGTRVDLDLKLERR